MNRERAPFVLTPDFEYVMGKRVSWPLSFLVLLLPLPFPSPSTKGSDLFKRFEETALEAYMVIRRNANLFINLFSMV